MAGHRRRQECEWSSLESNQRPSPLIHLFICHCEMRIVFNQRPFRSNTRVTRSATTRKTGRYILPTGLFASHWKSWWETIQLNVIYSKDYWTNISLVNIKCGEFCKWVMTVWVAESLSGKGGSLRSNEERMSMIKEKSVLFEWQRDWFGYKSEAKKGGTSVPFIELRSSRKVGVALVALTQDDSFSARPHHVLSCSVTE